MITIVIFGSMCGLKNVKQIHQWTASDRVSEFLKERFGISHVPCYYGYDNNIEITFTNSDGEELTLRLEMLTGISVDGQAVKCKEMLDLLRQNQILKKIQRGQNQNVVIQDDIPTKIKKLNELKEAGILSEEEFQQKKSELLTTL